MGYLSAFINVWKEIKQQKRFSQSFLVPYLHELERKYNGHFEPEQKKKITDYYGLFITSFLCSSYKRLYGKTLTAEERKRATLFGILTPVGDDLFDIDKLTTEDIYTLTFRPEDFTATTFSGHVAKEIQTYLIHHVPHLDEYMQASADVLRAQIEAEKQKDKNIPQPELRRITYTKGAVSVVIYHQCLDEAASEVMLDALFFVGSLYQVGNDLFNLYKDVRDNIYTLVNTCPDYKMFRKLFLERVRKQNEKIISLPYDSNRKRDFCIIMNTINARSLIAINQFIRMQQKTGGAIDWWSLPRKSMIVDMEHPVNFIKWLYYIYKLPKLLPKAILPKP